MFRLTISTCHGTFKLSGRIEGTEGAERHLHESPSTMTLPLWILAILAVVAGAIGLPNFVFGPLGWENWLSNWLAPIRSEEHTSELQSRGHLVCRLLLEKKK